MRISAPGSEAAGPGRTAAGFTLIELMVVVMLIAIASAVASLALRDPQATELEREGTRLAALLEAGRAESRALGMPVRWMPGGTDARGDPVDFHFAGLPPTVSLPTHWLQPDVHAQVLQPDGAPSPLGVLLGPEPVIGEQRIVLYLDDQQVVLHTDGLAPFALESAPAATPGVTSLRDTWPQEARHAPS